MSLQIGTDGERTFAIFTFVGLFASVRAEMASQVGRPWKYFATELTSISVKLRKKWVNLKYTNTTLTSWGRVIIQFKTTRVPLNCNNLEGIFSFSSYLSFGFPLLIGLGW